MDIFLKDICSNEGTVFTVTSYNRGIISYPLYDRWMYLRKLFCYYINESKLTDVFKICFVVIVRAYFFAFCDFFPVLFFFFTRTAAMTSSI